MEMEMDYDLTTVDLMHIHSKLRCSFYVGHVYELLYILNPVWNI